MNHQCKANLKETTKQKTKETPEETAKKKKGAKGLNVKRLKQTLQTTL
jgi:hypothetical protein